MIRKIKQEEISEVNQWFIHHNQTALPLQLLSENGYCDENFLTAAWFTVSDEVPICWIMFLVSRPNANALAIARALEDLLTGIEAVAAALDKTFVFTTSNNPAYDKFLKNHGWEAGHSLTHYCKVCHKQFH